jgi:choline dehydrogenase-like flavoprotein
MPLSSEFHGTSGPIHTGFNDCIMSVENDFIKACEEVTGIPNKPVDPWSGDHIGFYHTLGSVCRTGSDKGKRSYAARGYYEANRARPNLQVLCEALVNSVVLDGNKATGVSFTHDGRGYQISARREVIVCGGTIKSPQILELSGIGEPAVLEAAGVECKVANPGVGNNVQDHSLSILMFEVQPGVSTLDTLHQKPEVMQDALKRYTETSEGPLSCISSMQGFFPAKKILSKTELQGVIESIRHIKPASAFHQKQLRQIIAHLESDHSANIQLILVPASAYPDGVEHQSKLFPPRSPDQPAGFTFAVCLQYPVARGYIHIRSAGKFNQTKLVPKIQEIPIF